MGYVTSIFPRKVLAAAGAGADTDGLLRFIGLDPDGAWDPKAMIPDTTYYDMLERLAAQADVTDLPVRVGASMRCDDYGALGLAWKAARNLRGALGRVERYARLWTSVVSYELQPHARGMLWIVYRPGERRLGLRLSNEITLVATLALAREACGAPLVPLEVRVAHPAPRSTAAHTDWFGCELRFGASCDAVLFARKALEQPNLLGDEGISRFLLSYLDAELSQVSKVPLVTRARAAIAQALTEGTPKVAEIARALGLSARSFHRRLAEHGLNFQTLTEATRRDLAEGLRRDDGHSLTEIAFLTGFSEQSAFTRAFKRWTGTTPASYRRHHAPR